MGVVHQLNLLLHDTIAGSILLTFILLIILVAMNWKYISEFLRTISRRTWLILVLIFLIALALRIFIPPYQHIIYIDEAWYMEAGKDMLQTGIQGYYPKSIGWPFILRIAFGFFGVSNWVALYTSVLLGSLTVFTIFFMAFIITKNRKLSLISSLIFSLFPVHIRWSSTAETNVATMFFICLTVFLFFLYYKKKENSLLWLAMIALAFTVQFRLENYLLIILFIIGKGIYDSGFYKQIEIKEVLPFILMILLSFGNLVQSVDLYQSSDWIESVTGGRETGENWSFANLVENSAEYGVNIFNGEYQPLLLLLFMLVGLFYMFRNYKKESLFLIAWFVLFWVVYFASWFRIAAGNNRFYMSFYPITLIFICYGIIVCSNMLKRKHLALWCILIIVVILFIPHIIDAKTDNTDNARLLETHIPELAERDLPQDCLIVMNWPTVLKSTTDLNVIDVDSFLENYEAILDNNCVLFFEDYTCFDEKVYGLEEKCDEVKAKFLLVMFKSYSMRDKTYSFFEVSEKALYNNSVQ